MHVAVLMGGDSPEREISLLSGRAVAQGLEEAGHEVTAIDLPRVAAVFDPEILDRVRAADVVFPALHGGDGEDGHLQAALDLLEVPYALSGHAASALAMDKGSSKRVMRAAGVPTPGWLQVTWSRRQHEASGLGLDENPTLMRLRDRAADELGYPLVIKLNGAGSSVGVAIVAEPGEFVAGFAKVIEAVPGPRVEVLIEEFIPGRELTAAVFLGRRLPLVEIRPREGFYDYDNKYTEGASDYLVPAPVHSPVYENMAADALRVYELIGCRGLARVDFRLDGDNYKCLEINTIPGMTAHSLVPKAAEAVGIGFQDLIEDVCRSAMSRGDVK
jgi:D-alanine-D-alanine ligase